MMTTARCIANSRAGALRSTAPEDDSHVRRRLVQHVLLGNSRSIRPTGRHGQRAPLLSRSGNRGLHAVHRRGAGRARCNVANIRGGGADAGPEKRDPIARAGRDARRANAHVVPREGDRRRERAGSEECSRPATVIRVQPKEKLAGGGAAVHVKPDVARRPSPSRGIGERPRDARVVAIGTGRERPIADDRPRRRDDGRGCRRRRRASRAVGRGHHDINRVRRIALPPTHTRCSRPRDVRTPRARRIAVLPLIRIRRRAPRPRPRGRAQRRTDLSSAAEGRRTGVHRGGGGGGGGEPPTPPTRFPSRWSRSPRHQPCAPHRLPPTHTRRSSRPRCSHTPRLRNCSPATDTNTTSDCSTD